MVLLFHTTYISVYISHREIFRANVGKGGIKLYGKKLVYTFFLYQWSDFEQTGTEDLKRWLELGDLDLCNITRVKKPHEAGGGACFLLKTTSSMSSMWSSRVNDKLCNKHDLIKFCIITLYFCVFVC